MTRGTFPAALLLALSLQGGRATAAQPAAPGPGPRFMFFRYASHTSLSLYGGYGVSSWLLVLGLVQNPRTDYREAIAGVAGRVDLGRWGAVTVAPAVAYASDGWYGQLYLVPSLRWSSLSLSGTVELYAPLEARGATQYYLNPLTLFADVPQGRGLKAGVTYIHYGQLGSPTGRALGPAFQAPVPHGTITLDLVAGLINYQREARVTFQAAL